MPVPRRHPRLQGCDIGDGKARVRQFSAQGQKCDRQLPVEDEIFLDHVGHFVRDPDAASRALARAGFAPAPVSVQVIPIPDGTPQRTGTGNVTAMFRAAISRCCSRPRTRRSAASSTQLSRATPACISRPSRSTDAATAHARLDRAGFRMQPLVQMQRPVDTGGGARHGGVHAGARRAGEMPEGRIQILTHRTEAMVWQPRWLSHPNGALALTSVTIAVGDVDEAAQRFARFTGRDACPRRSGKRSSSTAAASSS